MCAATLQRTGSGSPRAHPTVIAGTLKGPDLDGDDLTVVVVIEDGLVVITLF